VVDESAYVLLCKSRCEYPCMSFDIIQDNLGEGEDRSSKFPISMSIVGGTYSGRKNVDSLILMKYSKLFPSSKNAKDQQQRITEQDRKSQSATLRYVKISHAGSVNRVRCKNINNSTICSSWSENGRVYMWNLDKAIKAIASDKLMNSFDARSVEPIFTFKGHTKEGFAMDFASTKLGSFASGDQAGKIYIWTSNQQFSSWNVNTVPLSGHTGSIEDIQWSPSEENILASCSRDRSIRVFDIRTPSNTSMVKISDAHQNDINVISWNKLDNPFLLSGGDDGAIKCWDLRTLGRSSGSCPIATFNHHSEPITSIEWNPTDSSVFVASSEDNQVSIFDLGVEKDHEQNANKDQDQEELDKLPPQLLFIHQGQKEIKEVHWHPQLPGYIVSTSLTGIDLFRTISV